jgi:hypothetical protein
MTTDRNSEKSALHRSAPLYPHFCENGAKTVHAPKRLHRGVQNTKQGKQLTQSTFAPLPRERSEFYELLSRPVRFSPFS